MGAKASHAKQSSIWFRYYNLGPRMQHHDVQVCFIWKKKACWPLMGRMYLRTCVLLMRPNRRPLETRGIGQHQHTSGSRPLRTSLRSTPVFCAEDRENASPACRPNYTEDYEQQSTRESGICFEATWQDRGRDNLWLH